MLDFANTSLVWALRGWSPAQGTAENQSSFYCRLEKGHSYVLSRADAGGIPEWKDVEYKQDGKHRLGYNPGTETRDVTQEDFDAVRASGKGYREGDKLALFNRKGGDRAALLKL